MSSKNTSRRNFLRNTALGLFSTAAAAASPRNRMMAEINQASAPTQQVPASNLSGATGDIVAWVTNDKLRFTRIDPIRWQPTSGTAPENTIVLDESKTYQDILGFGAAFTEAACFTFSRLEPSARQQLFHELFHPSEMGLNVCRTCIGSSDYSTEMFSYDEGQPDPEMSRFFIDHDKAYVLPMLREARHVNPDLF